MSMNWKKIPNWAIVLVVLTVVVLGFVWSKYNKLVSMQENTTAAWAQVENVYQRRADLIPNLVNTVKGYAAHEAETFNAVVEARAKATAIKLDVNTASEEEFQNYAKLQDELTAAVKTMMPRLVAISEAYPDLKANQNFLSLQDELAGTENRISVERKRYNEVVNEYNVAIRKFPTNVVASMFTFEAAKYFKAAEGANVAPVVQF